MEFVNRAVHRLFQGHVLKLKKAPPPIFLIGHIIVSKALDLFPINNNHNNNIDNTVDTQVFRASLNLITTAIFFGNKYMLSCAFKKYAKTQA